MAAKKSAAKKTSKSKAKAVPQVSLDALNLLNFDILRQVIVTLADNDLETLDDVLEWIDTVDSAREEADDSDDEEEDEDDE